MDIVHHGIIGLIGMNSAEDAKLAIGGVFFLIGSIFPDLDVFLMFFGKRVYLKNHQGFSHSLLLIPLYTLLIVALFLPVFDFSWLNILALSLGLLIHVLLDFSNTYGISLLYPLSKKRYAMDAVFFIDAFLLTLSVSMLIFSFSLAWYLGVFALYVLFKFLLQRSVHYRLDASFTIPSALNPFDFYIYQNGSDEIITYEYNALSQRVCHHSRQPNIDENYRHLTSQSQVYKDIEQITKAFHITKVTTGEDAITLHAKDMAVRNFGGKFATTTLVFDKEGRLREETSNI